MALKLNAEWKVLHGAVLFCVWQKINHKGIAYFSKINYRISLVICILRGISIARTSQVCTSFMLVLWLLLLLQFVLCNVVGQDLYTIICDEDSVLTLCSPPIVQCNSCPAILQYDYLMWPLGQYRLYCEYHSGFHLPRVIIICTKQKIILLYCNIIQ